MSQTTQLTDRQRERIDEIRDELNEAEPGVPAPTREQVIDSLLDTWDAIGRGHYHSPGEPSDTYNDITEHELWLTPFDMDHLRVGAPVFRGIGDHIALTLWAGDWETIEAVDSSKEDNDA